MMVYFQVTKFTDFFLPSQPIENRICGASLGEFTKKGSEPILSEDMELQMQLKEKEQLHATGQQRDSTKGHEGART